MDMETDTERTSPSVEAVKRHTDKLIAKGGSRFTIKLSPKHTQLLGAMCNEMGCSRTKALEHALDFFEKSGQSVSGKTPSA